MPSTTIHVPTMTTASRMPHGVRAAWALAVGNLLFFTVSCGGSSGSAIATDEGFADARGAVSPLPVKAPRRMSDASAVIQAAQVRWDCSTSFFFLLETPCSYDAIVASVCCFTVTCLVHCVKVPGVRSRIAATILKRMRCKTQRFEGFQTALRGRVKLTLEKSGEMLSEPFSEVEGSASLFAGG